MPSRSQSLSRARRVSELRRKERFRRTRNGLIVRPGSKTPLVPLYSSKNSKGNCMKTTCKKWRCKPKKPSKRNNAVWHPWFSYDNISLFVQFVLLNVRLDRWGHETSYTHAVLDSFSDFFGKHGAHNLFRHVGCVIGEAVVVGPIWMLH